MKLTLQDFCCPETLHGAQEMAAKIVATLLEGDTEVGEPTQAEKLFDFIAPLTADIPGADAGQDEEVRPHEHTALQQSPGLALHIKACVAHASLLLL